MKKFIGIIAILFTIITLSFNTTVKADNTTTNETDIINVYIFTKDGCSHCAEAKEFFAELSEDKTYGKMFNLVVTEVYDSEWNADENNMAIMNAVAKVFGDDVQGVPYIVIGDSYSLNGYSTSYDDEIKKAIKQAYNNEDYQDVVAPIIENYALLGTEETKKNDTGVIIAILVVVIAGCGALVYFSRK